MRWILRPVAAVMLVGLALAGASGPADAKAQRPEFLVVSAEDDFEIRDYPLPNPAGIVACAGSAVG